MLTDIPAIVDITGIADIVVCSSAFLMTPPCSHPDFKISHHPHLVFLFLLFAMFAMHYTDIQNVYNVRIAIQMSTMNIRTSVMSAMYGMNYFVLKVIFPFFVNIYGLRTTVAYCDTQYSLLMCHYDKVVASPSVLTFDLAQFIKLIFTMFKHCS